MKLYMPFLTFSSSVIKLLNFVKNFGMRSNSINRMGHVKALKDVFTTLEYV